MNGASWYDLAHHPLSTTGASDASSSSWAGVVHGTPGSGEVFRAAADFTAEWVSSHINVKETFALYEVLRPLVEARPDFPESPHYHDGRRQYSDDLRRTKSPGTERANAKLVRKLFWLQVQADFTFKLRWITLGRKLRGGPHD